MIISILKKLGTAIPVLLVVSIVLFVLLNALPGDAADATASMDATREEVEKIREEMGLNDPVYIRYWKWISGIIFRGDFGNSLINGTSVSQAIAQRFPITLELTLLAMFVAALIALPLGIVSATHRNQFIDNVASFLAMIGQAMPHFWLGMLMVLLFSVNLHWFPASGFSHVWKDGLGQNLLRLIMPTFAIGFTFAAGIMRQTRSAMLDVLDQDYMSTAKAKGLPGRKIVWKHALKNALIPVITVMGMQTGRLFGGAIVIETVFAIPGLGSKIVESIFSRDYQVTLGCVMTVAIIIILINTLVDILYVIIDPRISHGRKGD